MKSVSRSRVHEVATLASGLDPTALDLSAVEVIAANVRRAAGFLCPCPENALVSAVVDACAPLVDDYETFLESVEDIVAAIIAHGDLFELECQGRQDHLSSARLLYLVPPSFVRRTSGAVILLGILPDNESLLSDELSYRVEHINHVRTVVSATDLSMPDQLLSLGYNEIALDSWLKMPPHETSYDVVHQMDQLLEASGNSGEIASLQILDYDLPVRYYRGRWITPQAQSGRFVGRRAQAYGAPIWCYVELQKGVPIRMVDLPLSRSQWRGCDDAWRLQAAIDAERGHPQICRLRPGIKGITAIDVFSPLPMWAIRRLTAVGRPATAMKCLQSIAFRHEEVTEEVQFLKDHLWMQSSD